MLLASLGFADECFDQYDDNEEDCNADPNCFWHDMGGGNSHCMTDSNLNSCMDFTTAAECNADNQCIWMSEQGHEHCMPVSSSDCEGLSYSECEMSTDCHWKNDSHSHMDSDCIQFDTQSMCNQQPHCAWDSEYNECMGAHDSHDNNAGPPIPDCLIQCNLELFNNLEEEDGPPEQLCSLMSTATTSNCECSEDELAQIECFDYMCGGIEYMVVEDPEDDTVSAVSYTHLTLPTICSV